ncbi:MAG: patatin-like phospholipase family protein [Caldilineaceae bacterium]|jgi:NTE family protein|nr:patatin-like phospholipase family protein [Caldilineaceae bacterium]
MIAFVLSGAGNRGPLQVGAVRALLEAGITPDLIVGTSAGALNGGVLAAHGPTVAVTEQMEQLWASAKAGEIYPEGILEILWRLKSKANSLFTSGGMRDLLKRALPAGVTTFGQCKTQLYTTATDLRTSRLYVFGDKPDAALIDAVQASASVPIVHPPIDYGQAQLVDGGVVANVPVSVAIDHGATTIYVINAGYNEQILSPVHGVLEVLMRTISTMLAQNILQDIARAKADNKVDMHHIPVQTDAKISFFDFSQSAKMVAQGYAAAQAYLIAPAPMAPLLAGAAPAPDLPGATPYTPPYMVGL